MDELQDAQLIVVGAGFYGATLAECASRERGLRVLVIDRRSHIGGNAWSQAEPQTGIDVHRYGPHFFHTPNEVVWNYLHRFSDFNAFQFRGWSKHRGQLFSLPINLSTICQFFGRAMGPDEARQLIAGQTEDLGGREPANLEERAIAAIGRPLYEAFIRTYTAKQWQTDPRELPASIIGRLPIRYTFDGRYFSDRYQGQPVNGYATLFERMLTNPNIAIRLNTDWRDVHLRRPAKTPIVYTGPIDQYFDYVEGHLGWRTTDFDQEVVPTGDYQGTVVVNYADADVPFTRIAEYRHLHPERAYPSDRTVIVREYPRFAQAADEPFYPINTAADRQLYQRYQARAAAEANVVFGGRLGTYTYLDMHQAVALALRDWANLSERIDIAWAESGRDS